MTLRSFTIIGCTVICMLLIAVGAQPGVVRAATIAGYKFEDLDRNTIRNTGVVVGAQPHVVMVIDVSGSTSAEFGGAPVGDLNGDGFANAILDAEIAGFIALNENLVASGLGATANVGLVVFGSTATISDMNSVLAGVQRTAHPADDYDGDGTPDVEDVLRSLQYGGGTYFEPALQQAIAIFQSLATVPANGNLIFISDGYPSDVGTYADEVATLRALADNVRAFGAGTGADLSTLQVIDPDAEIFATADDLVGKFGGVGPGAEFTEPGLAGVTLYLDLDDDQVRDPGEPSTSSDADGNFLFTGVAPGVYLLREVVPSGMEQTVPGAGADFAYTVAVTGSDDVIAARHFGNVNVLGEICDNCVDDDGDMLADAADSDCPAAPGAGADGLDDPKGRGTAALACGKAAAKAGAKYGALTLKGLQRCVQTMFACVQQKPADLGCRAKASAVCAKGIDAIATKAQPKLAAGLRKRCGPDAIAPADLQALEGVGYARAASRCAGFGTSGVAGVDDVVTCLDRHHRCRAEAMLGLEVPRAAELLGLAGRTPASEFPCLVAPADGGSEGLDEPGARRKAAATCAAAIEKAALKFVRGGLAAVQKCADLVHGCVQRATDPSACLVKVRAACAKQQAKLTGAPKSIDAKLAAAVRKACDATKVGAADLLDPRGLGFAAHAARCAALGVPALTSATDVAACVTREHRCRTLQMLEVAVPRLDELLGLGALAP